MIRFRSIITRIVALHVVAIVVTSILMPLALYWLLNQAANRLHRDALRSEALIIGNFLHPQPDGRLEMDIPADMKALYSPEYGLYVFAVLDDQKDVLFSSRPDGKELFTPDKQSITDWFIRRTIQGSRLFGVTVVRPIGGALLSMAIIDGGDPKWQVASFLLGGGAALVAHAGKAGARTLVNASPEPVSNMVVSTGEDIATAGLLALAIANPIAAAVIALVLVGVSVWLVMKARRFLRRILEPKRRPAG